MTSVDDLVPCSRCQKKFKKKELFLMPQKDEHGKEVWVCFSCWNMIT